MEVWGPIATAILTTVVGAVGGIYFEKFKRKDDRRGVASAIAGEIQALIDGIEFRNMPMAFGKMAVDLVNQNPPPAPPWAFHDPAVVATPVLNAYISRVGVLGGDLPQRAARFYTLLAGLRLDVKLIAAGAYNSKPHVAAAVMTNGIKEWQIISVEGKHLVQDLQALSRPYSWWG